MSKIIGLTGGIAVGKSKVSETFIAHNIPVIDADQIARQVIEPNSLGYNLLISTFGSEIISNNKIDRVLLANIVYNNKNNLIKLNEILHPLIQKEADNQLNKFDDLVVFDAALLIENKIFKYKPLIVVECSLENQITRLMKRKSLSREEALLRINVQIPTKDKIKFADYVINTDGKIEESIKKTEDIIKILRS